MNNLHDIPLLDQSSHILMSCLLDKLGPLITTAPDELGDDMRYELVKLTQQLAIEARQLYSRTTTESDHDAEKAELLDLGYHCERNGQTVRIELPLLLPKRGGDSTFITEPLHRLLSLEQDIQRIRECVVVFRQIYGEGKKAADIRDHDNVESRAVLNVIERYFLISDSGYYCANIHMSEFGRSSKTVISLFPGRFDIHKCKEAVIP